jgi:hypothetical protein
VQPCSRQSSLEQTILLPTWTGVITKADVRFLSRSFGALSRLPLWSAAHARFGDVDIDILLKAI